MCLKKGNPGKIYGLFYIKDIDETKRKYLEQERAAATDPLTNVMNRRNFEMLVREAIQRRKRTEKCALLVFDIDNFKKINDARGHQAGDQVLKEFSKILTEAFRKSDAIGRFGGDEFVVFVKGMPEKSDRSETRIYKRENKRDQSGVHYMQYWNLQSDSRKTGV